MMYCCTFVVLVSFEVCHRDDVKYFEESSKDKRSWRKGLCLRSVLAHSAKSKLKAFMCKKKHITHKSSK